MGFSTLVTTLMQVPYGCIIAISILSCVFLNDYMSRHGKQTRCYFILLYLCPNIAGAFGLRFLDQNNQAGRLVSYYLTGPYNAAFVLILSLSTANTAGHTKKVITNAVLFLGYCTVRPSPTPVSPPLPPSLHRPPTLNPELTSSTGQPRRPLLLPRLAIPNLPPRHLEHDRRPSHRSCADPHPTHTA